MVTAVAPPTCSPSPARSTVATRSPPLLVDESPGEYDRAAAFHGGCRVKPVATSRGWSREHVPRRRCCARTRDGRTQRDIRVAASAGEGVERPYRARRGFVRQPRLKAAVPLLPDRKSW